MPIDRGTPGRFRPACSRFPPHRTPGSQKASKSIVLRKVVSRSSVKKNEQTNNDTGKPPTQLFTSLGNTDRRRRPHCSRLRTKPHRHSQVRFHQRLHLKRKLDGCPSI